MMAFRLRLHIWHKLFFTLVMVIALILALTAMIGQHNFTQGFQEYLEAVEQRRIARLEAALVEEYRQHQSWDWLQQNPRRWYQLIVQADLARPPPERRPANRADAERSERDGREPRTPAERRDARAERQAPDELEPREERRNRPRHSPLPSGRVSLLDAERQAVIGPRNRRPADVFYPIELDEAVIGYLGVERQSALHHLIDRQFAKQQVQAFYLSALLGLLVAVVAAWLLARQLSRPVGELAGAAQRLMQGDFDARVERRGSDELASLAQDFNRLAETLEQNRISRNQWIADISHELRTPLTVLRGELDALEDGVRPLNLDAVRSLALEVKQLQRLVQDLYELSLSDLGALTYHKEPLVPVQLLQEQIGQFEAKLAQRELNLELNLESCAEVEVLADPQRLAQLFSNLLENSLRYTDPGGRVRISARADGALWLLFEDSAPGLDADQRARMFERLYRADRSRSRAYGGSGLGLSIVSSIVAAHGGNIRAEASDLGGIKIEIQLPRRPAGWENNA